MEADTLKPTDQILTDPGHTPGPWSVDEHGHVYADEFIGWHTFTPVDGTEEMTVKQGLIALVYSCGWRTGKPGSAGANARLVAAAPELLDVARELLEFWDHGTAVQPGAEVVAELRAAVAKATRTPS